LDSRGKEVRRLSSGEFVGVTADDPGVEAGLKGFHARIVRQEMKVGNGQLPIINHPVDEGRLRQHFEGVRRDMEVLVEREFGKLVQDEDKKGVGGEVGNGGIRKISKEIFIL